MRWELSEFDIKYMLKKAIKAYVLMEVLVYYAEGERENHKGVIMREVCKVTKHGKDEEAW